MTEPVDITDPLIAKACAHPLRIQILAALENRVASPSQLAKELGATLPVTSYHVRQLDKVELLKLVRRRQRRGSIEHFYTATVRPTIYDETWARVPAIVKRAMVGGRLGQLGSEVMAAAEAGGFDDETMHLTRTRLLLTEEGWRALSGELLGMLDRIDAIAGDDAARAEARPDAQRRSATVAMMLFESPPGEGVKDTGAEGARKRSATTSRSA